MFTSESYRIYVHETDAAGVVHHSNYLRFFEAGRIEFLRSIGQDYINFQTEGIGFVPIHIDIRYHKPLRQDDLYQVTVNLKELKKASFIIEQSIRCNDELMVSATIQLACVKEPAFKPTRLPNMLINALSQSE